MFMWLREIVELLFEKMSYFFLSQACQFECFNEGLTEPYLYSLRNMRN